MFVETIQAYLDEFRIFSEMAPIAEDKGVTEQNKKASEVLQKLMSNSEPGKLNKSSNIIAFNHQEIRTLSL